MPLSDLSPLTYFKELHLLSRVIFSIGGVLFFSGLAIKDWIFVLFGVGLIFASVGYNFFAGLVWYDPSPPYRTHISWSNLFQGLLSFVLAIFVLYVTAYHYRHGVWPHALRPI